MAQSGCDGGRQRATLHHERKFYALRNHLVDFLVSRSKDLSHGRAPQHPPEVRPGDEELPGAAVVPAAIHPKAAPNPSTPPPTVTLHRVA